MLYREKLKTPLGMVEVDWWIVLIGSLEILLERVNTIHNFGWLRLRTSVCAVVTVIVKHGVPEN
jgi:hypothetical protein